MQLQVPARYWDDYTDRSPVDSESQMPVEVSRTKTGRVTIEAAPEQLRYLLADAKFYADGNTDDTPRAVVTGARTIVSKLAALPRS